MLKLKTSAKYRKNLVKLPKNIQELATRKLALFVTNHRHEILRTHKLKGELDNFYSFSVKYQYRIVFKLVKKDTALLLDIGTHGIYQ